MLQIILILVCLGIAVTTIFMAKKSNKMLKLMGEEGSSKRATDKVKLKGRIAKSAGIVSALASIALFISLSIFYVDDDEVGHTSRIYFGSNMPVGQIIARDTEDGSQNGPQANIYAPGFKFVPFIRFTHDIEFFPVERIPAGQYGLLVAADGLSLREGQIIADPWENYNDMIDADKFLVKGQRGTQLTVLPPADYRFNHYLFSLKLGGATTIDTGEVGVVRSTVSIADNCNIQTEDAGGLTTNLVPKDCKGVWNEPLYQGMYYLNQLAYKVDKISTRVQTWVYKGGYTQRTIDITVDQNGDITQQAGKIKRDVPTNAADKAINVRVEGWTVPVDVRVPVQISAKNAPKVVAGVGSLVAVEDKIVTPAIRNVLRTIGGAEGAKVLDFVTKRDMIAAKVKEAIVPIAAKAGVTVLDTHLGEPAIPPELLVANQRNQIANQLETTFKSEKKAQRLRIAVEAERAKADQQPKLIKAQIAREAAKQLKEKRRLEGEGEKLYLTQLAEGEKARKDVLGGEAVVQLKMMEILAEHPELVKVPGQLTVVGEGSSELGTLGALLGGHSNVAKSMGTKVVK